MEVSGVRMVIHCNQGDIIIISVRAGSSEVR